MTGTATVNGTPMGGNLNEEEPFTYTYTGTASAGQGVMTGTDEDGTESSLPFTINGNELIIPFDLFGEEIPAEPRKGRRRRESIAEVAEGSRS